MRSSIFQIILLLSFLSPTLCYGQDKAAPSTVKLRHVWRVGEVQKYRRNVLSEHILNKRERNRLQLFPVIHQLTSYWTQTVLKVDETGTATVKIQWTRFVEGSTKNPKAKPVVEVDTEKFALLERPNARQKLFKALLRIPFTIRIDNRGRMSKLQGLDKGIKEFLKRERISRSEKRVYVEAWSEERVLREFQGNFFTLPSLTIRAQSKWMELAQLSRIDTTLNYEDWNFKLENIKRWNSRTQVVVKGTSTQSLKKVDPRLNEIRNSQVEFKSNSHKFRAIFDVTQGQFQEFDSTREFSGQVTNGKTSIYQYRIKRTLTINRIEDAKNNKKKN